MIERDSPDIENVLMVCSKLSDVSKVRKYLETFKRQSGSQSRKMSHLEGQMNYSVKLTKRDVCSKFDAKEISKWTDELLHRQCGLVRTKSKTDERNAGST